MKYIVAGDYEEYMNWRWNNCPESEARFMPLYADWYTHQPPIYDIILFDSAKESILWEDFYNKLWKKIEKSLGRSKSISRSN